MSACCPPGTSFAPTVHPHLPQPITAVQLNGDRLRHSNHHFWEWNPGQAINPRGPFQLALLGSNKQVKRGSGCVFCMVAAAAAMPCHCAHSAHPKLLDHQNMALSPSQQAGAAGHVQGAAISGPQGPIQGGMKGCARAARGDGEGEAGRRAGTGASCDSIKKPCSELDLC